MSLILTSSLQKSLPALTSATSRQNWEKIVVDFIGQKQNETLSLISRLNENIAILEHQKAQAAALISILEEAGGLTVRTRNLMSTPEDIIKYDKKIKEFADWFNLARTKFDKTALESGKDGINLMNGDRLETLFDTKGQNKIVTEGIEMSCAALGIRPADFSTLFSLQNARIDVMNAIDIAVTVKNTIAANIANLTISQGFAQQAIELSKSSQTNLATSNLESETLNLIKLGRKDDLFDGEKMAEPTQQEILNSFAASPNMEDI